MRKTSTAVQNKRRPKGGDFNSYRRVPSGYSSKSVIWVVQMTELILFESLRDIRGIALIISN